MVTFFWLLPAYNPGGTIYGWRIPFGGPGGLIRTALTHPGQLISYITTHHRIWYLCQLFAPVGFMAVAAPGVMLIGLGALAANLLSTFPYQNDIRYHYTTIVYPVIVAATIFGIAQSTRTAEGRRLATMAVVGASFVTAYLWGPTPLGKHEAPISDPNSPLVASFHRANRLLPRDAVVSAHYGWLPQITHRTEAYMFPNPWRASYWGTFKQEGQRLPQADRVEYVMIPSQLDPEPRAVLDSIREEFDVLYDEGGVLLLKRKP
jgi:uncharacterized membrane protein